MQLGNLLEHRLDKTCGLDEALLGHSWGIVGHCHAGHNWGIVGKRHSWSIADIFSIFDQLYPNYTVYPKYEFCSNYAPTIFSGPGKPLECPGEPPKGPGDPLEGPGESLVVPGELLEGI